MKLFGQLRSLVAPTSPKVALVFNGVYTIDYPTSSHIDSLLSLPWDSLQDSPKKAGLLKKSQPHKDGSLFLLLNLSEYPYDQPLEASLKSHQISFWQGIQPMWICMPLIKLMEVCQKAKAWLQEGQQNPSKNSYSNGKTRKQETYKRKILLHCQESKYRTAVFLVCWAVIVKGMGVAQAIIEIESKVGLKLQLFGFLQSLLYPISISRLPDINDLVQYFPPTLHSLHTHLRHLTNFVAGPQTIDPYGVTIKKVLVKGLPDWVSSQSIELINDSLNSSDQSLFSTTLSLQLNVLHSAMPVRQYRFSPSLTPQLSLTIPNDSSLPLFDDFVVILKIAVPKELKDSSSSQMIISKSPHSANSSKLAWYPLLRFLVNTNFIQPDSKGMSWVRINQSEVDVWINNKGSWQGIKDNHSNRAQSWQGLHVDIIMERCSTAYSQQGSLESRSELTKWVQEHKGQIVHSTDQPKSSTRFQRKFSPQSLNSPNNRLQTLNPKEAIETTAKQEVTIDSMQGFDIVGSHDNLQIHTPEKTALSVQVTTASNTKNMDKAALASQDTATLSYSTINQATVEKIEIEVLSNQIESVTGLNPNEEEDPSLQSYLQALEKVALGEVLDQ